MAKKSDERGVDAPRRKRLEALRDDCRRHKRSAVALVQRSTERRGYSPELEKPILMARSDEDEHDAKGLLDRLGEVLADAPDLLDRLGIESDRGEWRRSRRIAMEALLRSRTWRKIIESGATLLESEEVLEVNCVTFERRSPDLFASIAELCDELLEVKPSAEARKRKRVNPGALWHDAVKTLRLMREAGKDPSDADIAVAIGVSKATFSRHVGSNPTWTEERAGRLAATNRQGSSDPEAWADR
jgi:hypothetical protein